MTFTAFISEMWPTFILIAGIFAAICLQDSISAGLRRGAEIWKELNDE